MLKKIRIDANKVIEYEERPRIYIRDLVKITHENARNKGFWEDWDSIGWEVGLGERYDSTLDMDILYNNATATRLMLIVSEASEALEALRENDKENFKEELADIIIRTCDLAGGLGMDLEKEVIAKIEKNKNRSYKHGKRF